MSGRKEKKKIRLSYEFNLLFLFNVPAIFLIRILFLDFQWCAVPIARRQHFRQDVELKRVSGELLKNQLAVRLGEGCECKNKVCGNGKRFICIREKKKTDCSSPPDAT